MECNYINPTTGSNLAISNFNRSIPHEIGIFLGIPRGDVEGFIKNQGKNYLLNGYWKVYTGLDRAIELFRSYDASRYMYLNKLINSSK